jgi:cytochrome c
MKKILKWVGIVLAVLVVAGFFGFLYFIPPFTLIPPEEFTKQTAAPVPSLDSISDPAERLLAERGRYIVTVHDCNGCHTPLGENGPKGEEYLAGGNKTVFRGYGTFVSRNLTPDKETGLARRTDEQVKRVLRGGLLPEGRVAHYRDMPWPMYSHFTEEDRHAVVVYLRHLKPVFHGIPEDITETSSDDTTAIETPYTFEVARHAGDTK